MLTTMFPLSDVSEADSRRIIAKFDVDGDGQIDFKEFLAMMTQAEQQDKNSRDEILEAFKVFDKDGDGTITAKEIVSVMQRLGEDIDLQTAKLMIQSVDLDGNGSIDADEFRNMMRDGMDMDANVHLTYDK